MGELLEGQEHHFNPVNISAPHIIYVALGFFIVLVCFMISSNLFKFGIFSMLVKERLYMGEAPLALVFGIIIGKCSLFQLTKFRTKCCKYFSSE